MEVLIIGGDERMAWMARLLRRDGWDARQWGRVEPSGRDWEALGEADAIVTNCPPRAKGVELDGVLDRAKAGASIYLCGPGTPGRRDDGRLIDLWADEALKRENARLTAEGAVAAAMRASRRTIGGERCLVVGWGRIGRALTELLVAMGARVTVASRHVAGQNRAVERGAETADTANLGAALPGCRLIFNTAPAPVLTEAELCRADRDAMIVDLASAPYGVDLRAAWSMGLRAWREPALPGRYCPESAAEALIGAMRRAGFDERGEGRRLG